ncbi:MAG: hypothetical protein ACOX8W_02930 [bacterium]|jgi:hypothetical protein
MNFLAIKDQCWWAIDDAQHLEIDDTTMGALVNAALADLGPELNIVRRAVLEVTDGAAALPADFLAPVAVRHGAAPVPERRYGDEDDADVSGYFIDGSGDIIISGFVPTEPVTLIYLAGPPALADDADEPAALPERFRPEITVYVKARYALRQNRLDEYSGLMSVWESEVKRKVAAACSGDRRADSGAIEVV